jgi:hypothetical protein
MKTKLNSKLIQYIGKTTPNTKFKKGYIKKRIPKKIKEEVWVKTNGNKFTAECYVNWCSNKINVFNYHVGHNIPESKGGTLELNNLLPICDRCNLSMSNNYTIQEWGDIFKPNQISLSLPLRLRLPYVKIKIYVSQLITKLFNH